MTGIGLGLPVDEGPLGPRRVGVEVARTLQGR